MTAFAHKWIGLGTGALGALAFDDEAAALQYAQDCGAGEVVEYAPADHLRGAVDALKRIALLGTDFVTLKPQEPSGRLAVQLAAEALDHLRQQS